MHECSFFFSVYLTLLLVFASSTHAKEVVGQSKSPALNAFFSEVYQAQSKVLDETLKTSDAVGKKRFFKSTLQRNQKQYSRFLQASCKEDIKLYCAVSHVDSSNCLYENKKTLSEKCNSFVLDRLGSKPLENEMVYKGITIPKLSTLQYDKNKSISGAYTVYSSSYKGIKLAAGKLRIYTDEKQSKLVKSGVLLSPDTLNVGLAEAVLLEDSVVQGIPCRARLAKSRRQIFFHENGALERCDPYEDFTYNGVTYLKDRTTFSLLMD